MPIIVKHGFNAVAELGRQTGQAQGDAAAATIERESRKNIWNAFQTTADAFVRKKEIDDANARDDARRREDRTFVRDQQDRAFEHADDAQERGYLHADESQARAQDFTAGQNREHWNQAAGQFDRSNKIAEGHLEVSRKAQADNTADRKARRYTDLFEAGGRAVQQGADAQLKRAQAAKIASDEASKAQLQAFALEGLDREFTDPVTGQLKQDPAYFVNKAHILSGDFKRFTANIPNLPSGNGGKAAPPSEDDMVAVAATQPKYAMQVAQATMQPKPGELPMVGAGGQPGAPAPLPAPSKEAVQMLGAIAQVPYSPRFDPTRNPTYYQDLKNLEQGYRDSGAPEEMIAPIIQRVDELTAQREQYLLPRVQQQAFAAADTAMEASGPVQPGRRNIARAKALEVELAKAHIDVDEYEQWAERVAQAGSLFNLQRRDRMGEKRGKPAQSVQPSR